MLNHVAIFCFLLAGCNAAKKAHSYANSNPKEFADFCATNFPAQDSTFVSDSIRLDTILIPGEPVIETTYLHDTLLRTVYYPGTTQFVTKTIRHDSTIIRVDKAVVESKQRLIDALVIVNKDYVGRVSKFKKRSDLWMWVAIGLMTLTVIRIAWKIWGAKINLSGLFKIK